MPFNPWSFLRVQNVYTWGSPMIGGCFMPGTSANNGTPELLLTLEGIKKLEEELNTLKTA